MKDVFTTCIIVIGFIIGFIFFIYYLATFLDLILDYSNKKFDKTHPKYVAFYKTYNYMSNNYNHYTEVTQIKQQILAELENAKCYYIGSNKFKEIMTRICRLKDRLALIENGEDEERKLIAKFANENIDEVIKECADLKEDDSRLQGLKGIKERYRNI